MYHPSLFTVPKEDTPMKLTHISLPVRKPSSETVAAALQAFDDYFLAWFEIAAKLCAPLPEAPPLDWRLVRPGPPVGAALAIPRLMTQTFQVEQHFGNLPDAHAAIFLDDDAPRSLRADGPASPHPDLPMPAICGAKHPHRRHIDAARDSIANLEVLLEARDWTLDPTVLTLAGAVRNTRGDIPTLADILLDLCLR